MLRCMWSCTSQPLLFKHCTCQDRLRSPRTNFNWTRETQDPDYHVKPQDYPDSTEFLKQSSSEFEEAISQLHMQQQGTPSLPKCRGRAQRLEPEVETLAPIVCKQSRQGEVCLQSSLVGKAVRRWYTQLRRLQSLCHAVMANRPPLATMPPCGLQSFNPPWFSDLVENTGASQLAWCSPDMVHIPCKHFLHHVRAFETWRLAEWQASLRMKYGMRVRFLPFSETCVMNQKQILTTYGRSANTSFSSWDWEQSSFAGHGDRCEAWFCLVSWRLWGGWSGLRSLSHFCLWDWRCLYGVFFFQRLMKFWTQVVKFTQAHMPKFTFTLPPLEGG